jgi:hypothetical protein
MCEGANGKADYNCERSKHAGKLQLALSWWSQQVASHASNHFAHADLFFHSASPSASRPDPAEGWRIDMQNANYA